MKGGGEIVEKGHVTHTTVIEVAFNLYQFFAYTLFVRERIFHINFMVEFSFSCSSLNPF